MEAFRKKVRDAFRGEGEGEPWVMGWREPLVHEEIKRRAYVRRLPDMMSKARRGSLGIDWGGITGKNAQIWHSHQLGRATTKALTRVSFSQTRL